MAREPSAVPEITTRPSDRAVALAKNLASFVPGLGPLVAQILLDDIPGQRMDRIADYVSLLDDRLTAVELEQRRSDAEAIDLFEEGAAQSTRATTQSRREKIASIVAAGLKGDDTARLEAKRLLSLMQNVDDDQMIILVSKLHRSIHDEDFQRRHEAILDSPALVIGAGQELQDRSVNYELARSRLVQLGLLVPKFKKPMSGKSPEFDEKTGMMKAAGFELTPLGRLLLRRAGLAEANDF
jgi:hypothetical protein